MLNKKALAASVSAPPAEFVEDVFSTYLYTGNNSTQTINNGVDLDGEGGLVWIKSRSEAEKHQLFDTNRGNNFNLATNLTDGNDSGWSTYFNFQSTGFGLGPNGWPTINGSGSTYASWTFRKQPKFFDVVSYTGTGSNTTILHDLGSVPGMIIVKRTDTTGDWQVYHRANTANPETDYLVLNDTAATADSDTRWNDTLPTSAVFSLGTDATVNASGGNYVAYLFAHDAGGFGTSGTDNVISCGSFTTDGSGVITSPVNLGYEPQWILSKRVDSTGNWRLIDSMRGNPVADGTQRYLYANLSDAESGSYGEPSPTSTGFTVTASTANSTYIYMAIRRPMKVPTTGTSVFTPNVQTSPSFEKTFTTGFPVDLAILYDRNTTRDKYFFDRLRGQSAFGLESTTTDAESSFDSCDFDLQTTWKETVGFSTASALVHAFRRAPGFFDVVCYTGTGSATTQAHNLTVAPELMIVKRRNTSAGWFVYAAPLGNNKTIELDYIGNAYTSSNWNNTTPTSTVFSLGSSSDVNASASTYVAYLFATLAGVSKVGSYTGTAAAQTINCGFTAGARFVLIKRTDAIDGATPGGWHVWDTARGIVSGDDPYLLLNSTAAEVTNTDYIDPVSSGFELSSTAPAAINASGGTFIFLAVA